MGLLVRMNLRAFLDTWGLRLIQCFWHKERIYVIDFCVGETCTLRVSRLCLLYWILFINLESKLFYFSSVIRIQKNYLQWQPVDGFNQRPEQKLIRVKRNGITKDLWFFYQFCFLFQTQMFPLHSRKLLRVFFQENDLIKWTYKFETVSWRKVM